MTAPVRDEVRTELVPSTLQAELLRSVDLASAVVAWSERASLTLAAVRDVAEAKHVVDAMTVIATVCRVRDVHIEASLAASAMRVRAERRLGQLLAQQPPKVGRPPKTVDLDDSFRPLAEQGISRDESSRFQRLAHVDEDVFEQALDVLTDDARDRGVGNVTSTRVLREVNPEREKGDDERWLDGDRFVSAARRLSACLGAALPAVRFGHYPARDPLVREAAIKEIESARAACAAVLSELKKGEARGRSA